VLLPANPWLRRPAWGEVWRILAAALLGTLLYLVVQSQQHSGLRPMPSPSWLDTVDPLLGAVALGLMLFRRRWPLPIALATTALTALSVTALGPASISMISLATHRRWAQVAVAGVAWLVSGALYQELRPGSTAEDWANNALISVLSLAFFVAAGAFIGARRDLVASLRERVETAEREQTMRVGQARAAERARIAREMHDVLAHRISLVAMQSGALAYRTDLTREQTAQAAEVVRDNAHQALGELREVLGLLREAGEPEPHPRHPQPSLADLDDLLAETRASGVELRATVAVDDLSRVPDTISRNGYRIVQEALTNARKHAAGAPVDLEVRALPGDGLRIVARNGIPNRPLGERMPASGMGLTGLVERATLTGGELTYGTDRRGDFVLKAWLPWTS
jgi:signal transduction histidine kinase